MVQFPELDWTFNFNDRGTHSGNYLDKLNQLVVGFNTTINAYNAQLAAETDAQAQQALAEQFKNEALSFRNQAEAISLGNIQGTNLDLASCKVAGIEVAKQPDVDALNALIFSDDNSLNEIQEIVNFIKLNRNDLDTLTISSIAGLVNALADKLDKTARAADTKLIKGINPDFYKGLSGTNSIANPDDAITQVMLTNHARTPNPSSYWHITTTFYSSISATSNRGQIAVQYGAVVPQVYARSSYSGVWSGWGRIDNAGKAATAGNADTVGGLSVNPAARSNGANKVVRTDVSGYLNIGWLNSTSGKTTTGTMFACFNAANDMYLRWMDAAGMRAKLAVDSKIIRGSNSHGKYIKFPDGTAIAYGYNVLVAKGGSSITLPVSFLNGTVTVTAVATNSLLMATVSSTRATYFTPHMRVASSSVAIQGYINYIAIGEWK